MAAKARKRIQKTRKANAPRFAVVALGSVANMIASAATSAVLLGIFFLVKNIA